MKSRKLSPLLALSMSAQMILSPAAHAANSSDVAVGITSVTDMALQFYNTYIQARPPVMSPQMIIQQQALQNQTKLSPDKNFNFDRISSLPGFNEFIANSKDAKFRNINPAQLQCGTFPTTLTEVKVPSCTSAGQRVDPATAANQIHEAQNFMMAYDDIAKKYENAMQISNVGGDPIGIGCLENAQEILNGYFNYRKDELTKLIAVIKDKQAAFKLQTEADLNAIEEGTAVLDGGGNPELLDKIKTKRPDLFDWNKRFASAACQSMFNATKFKATGDGQGLSGINNLLQQTLSEPAPGQGFSGESYSRNHGDIVNDINSMSDKIAKQVELNFAQMSSDPNGYSDMINKLKSGVSSSNGLNNLLSADMFADAQANYNQSQNKWKKDLGQVNRELGGYGAQAIAMVNDPTISDENFEAELAIAERGIQNNCLKSSVNLDQVFSKIYDRSASKFANQNQSNYLKDQIALIMNNDKTSLDKKLADLKAAEQNTDNRYELRMQNSYKVDSVDANNNLVRKDVEASKNPSPGKYISDIINNCKAQYRANVMSAKMTAPAAMEELRKIRRGYKALQQSAAIDMKMAFKKRLLECKSSGTADAKVTGQCTTKSFDTSNPGFCATAALTCSKNMQDCAKQAQKYTDEIKTQRTARVNNYKKQLDKNKQDLIKMFNSTLSLYQREGEQLRAMFGSAGFETPTNIKYEVEGQGKYLSQFNGKDDKLLLEDPEAITKLFEDNVNSLIPKVQAQQDKIAAKIKDQIRQTKENYANVQKKAAAMAGECRAAADNMMNFLYDTNKAAQEQANKDKTTMGENSNSFCRDAVLISSNGAACQEKLNDLVKAASALPGASSLATEISDHCYKYGYMDKEGNSQADQASSMCPPANAAKDAKITAAKRKLEAANEALTKLQSKQDSDSLKSAAKEKSDAELALKKAKQALSNAESDLSGAKERPAAEMARLEEEVIKAKRTVEENELTFNHKNEAYTQEMSGLTDTELKTAEENVSSAQKQLDELVAGPAHKGRSTSNEAQLYALCSELRTCENGDVVTTSPDNKSKVVESACRESRINGLAKNILKLSGPNKQQFNLDGRLPGWCNAQMNGGREVPKNFVQQLTERLANPGRVQGQ